MRPIWRVVDVLGTICFWHAGLALLPILAAFTWDDYDLQVLGIAMPQAVPVFVFTALISSAVGLTFHLLGRRGLGAPLSEKEGYLAIGTGWILAGTLGMIPYALGGAVLTPGAAWFESMSGITATGATAISNLEGVLPSLLIWRSLQQFVAGLGIVVLAVAMLARLTHGGAQLLAADPAGHAARLKPRLGQTATVLWTIYGFIAGAAFLLYLGVLRFDAGLSWSRAVFDAAVHAMSSVSTGGFSSRDGNIAAFGSMWFEGATILVMLTAGTSFALLHRWRTHQLSPWRDTEWRWYMGFVVVSTLVMSGILFWSMGAAWTSAWDAFYTAVSFVTSTGYLTVDHDGWPALARLTVVVLMFTGAMAGSTSGGIKVLRVILLIKVARRELRRLLHPRAVIPIRLKDRSVEEGTLLSIIAFFFVYITFWLAGTFLLMATEPQLIMYDSAVAAAAAIGNTGPAAGVMGPFHDYSDLSGFSQMVLGTLMWIGRLEVFAALLIASPSSWRT